jgi:hypothetical protein
LLGIGLLLVVAVCVAAGAYYANRRIAALAYIESLGGEISFGDERRIGPVVLPAWMEPMTSRWMQPVVSVWTDGNIPCDLKRLEPLDEVQLLGLGPIDDEDAKSIPRFRQLAWLFVTSPKLSSAGLFHLGRSQSLECLTLAAESVDDGALEGLRGLPLVQLHLIRTGVTDAGMPELLKLSSLHMLSLRDARVTDACLSVLAKHPSLEWLLLDGTDVTDAGMKQLAPLRVRLLSLKRTAITNAGVAELAKLPLNLECLDLEETAVTPEGLRALAGKPGLTVVVSRSRFAEDELEALRESGLSIKVEPPETPVVP